MASYNEGDHVSNTRKLDGRGLFESSIPANTDGEVVSTRHGLFEEYATVKFEDGRTQEVKASDLQRESRWF